MSRLIIQIVPALPPATNGVGDYAIAIARGLRRDFGLDTLFVVGNERWQGPHEVEGFRVSKLATRSADRLEAVLDEAGRTSDSSSVLLQMSGYGYALRGCPFWLLQGLKRWKTKHPNSRLVTMFHELYAFGLPWSSAFWLNPSQRMVVGGIARVSDIAVTNIQRYRDRLEGLDTSKRGSIETLVVPSNVGEPLEPGKLSSRARSMVVFGLPASRRRSYETRMAALQRACEHLGITEVHDVGADFHGIPTRVGAVPVRKHGVMNASALSALLSDSMAGFVDYFPGYFGKSGVFAAYCAHRLIPVTAEDGLSEEDGITCGIHYYGVDEAETFSEDAQAIADAAWNWYQGHSLKSHAQTFADALQTAND